MTAAEHAQEPLEDVVCADKKVSHDERFKGGTLDIQRTVSWCFQE